MKYVIALLFMAINAFAIPQFIHYQGELTRPDGTPLDTTVAMTFRIYSAAAGGSPVWTESYSAVTVSHGSFGVQLGSLVALTDYFNIQRWLGVTIGTNTEMTPRQRIVSVAHAYRVGTVDGASGGIVTGKLNVGSNNTNTGDYAMVAGINNSASGHYSTIGGGQLNEALGETSTVGGGYASSATGLDATVAGGFANQAAADESTIGGGNFNIASGSASVVCGGGPNRSRGLYSFVGGGGGFSFIDSNSAVGDVSVICGGQKNRTTGAYSFVGGGLDNSVSGWYSVVAGGTVNGALGDFSTVIGGDSNFAQGAGSTVAGGLGNNAIGNHSLAAGAAAAALHDGTFVWSDGSNYLSSSTPGQFSVLAAGGVRLYSSATLSSGVLLAPGGSSWASVSDSTMKRDIHLTDTKAVLEKITALPIKNWEYKAELAGTEHIGPMAQDFWSAFHLGSDSLRIETIDADGILFAAVQALSKSNETLQAANDTLQIANVNLERRMARLEALLQSVQSNQQQTQLK